MKERNDMTLMSIAELHQVIKKKVVSPVEIVKKTIEKTISKNKEINAYITINVENALEQAKQAETDIMNGVYKGPLQGIPVGLKDIIHLKNTRTTCGSELRLNNIANQDAEIVKRLKSNGAIMLGKENMHSLAYGSTGDISHFGPVKNPLDYERISGGSSAGSAASIASGLSYGSIGSDTGGSIRIPSACCGVVGLKPTFGLISRSGTVSLASTLDTLGPITRTVYDNALILNAISGHDVTDSFSLKYSKEDYSEFIDEKRIKGTIGIPRQYYFEMIDSRILEVFDQTISDLKSLGFKIKLVDLPYMEEYDAALSVIFATEVYESLEKELIESPEKIEEEVRDRIVEGCFVKAHEYIKMHRVKHLAIETFKNILQTVDVIMTPTLCAFPCKIGDREVEINDEKINIRKVYSRLVRASNLTGFPAISVPRPRGLNDSNSPHSLQFISLPYQEKKLYQFAQVIEQLK